MFLRIFQYRVLPQFRDRHLAVQQRAARLYSKYVTRAPQYFRRSSDPHVWIELHWYADRAACQRVAAEVARDAELSRLWREFQDSLDPAFPVVLEEFDEYELPMSPSMTPFAQPPLETQTPPANSTNSTAAKPTTAADVVKNMAAPVVGAAIVQAVAAPIMAAPAVAKPVAPPASAAPVASPPPTTHDSVSDWIVEPLKELERDLPPLDATIIPPVAHNLRGTVVPGGDRDEVMEVNDEEHPGT